MKRIVFILILLFIFCWPVEVSAHLVGQPPFFRVNGSYANLYPVPLTSLNDFNLPQDLPSDNYLVGVPINFELDTTQLPVPPEIVQKTKFFWDFGDGGKSSGLRNTYTYKKMGSYILTIKVDDGTVPEPQLLESVLINVLPDKSYQLPQAVISVNFKQSKDPLTDILIIDMTKLVQFDASLSKSTSKITSYIWDFGDTTEDHSQNPTHLYQKINDQNFVVLRIENSDGFLADTFVEMKNGQSTKSSTTTSDLISQAQNQKSDQGLNIPNLLKYLGVGILGLVVILGVVKLIRKSS